jgi:hypothetical protein
MGQFSLSPSVSVKEIDFSGIVPAVASAIGASAGNFLWGPGNQRVTVGSENSLISIFGKPDNNTAQDWFTARNFLAYSNNLLLVRALASTHRNAVAAGTAVKIDNYDTFTAVNPAGTYASNKSVARYAGALGNGLVLSLADNASFGTWAYRNYFTTATAPITVNNTVAVSFTANTTTGSAVLSNVVVTSGSLVVGQTITGTGIPGSTTIISITNSSTITLSSNASATNTATALTGTVTLISSVWSGQPTTTDFVKDKGGVNDELHAVVIDATGLFTGTPGTILEKFTGLSKASDAQNSDRVSNYYIEVINRSSKYVYVTNTETTSTLIASPAQYYNNTGTAITGNGVIGSTATNTNFGNLSINGTTASVISYTLSGGVDGSLTDADKILAFQQFQNSEAVDVSLVMSGSSSVAVQQWLISNIAESRRDCVVFVSPSYSDVVNASGNEETNVVTWRGKLNSSSYVVADSGWKYQYDPYNDKYRWIPLNADTAGLCAQTDQIADAWWSPAGFNRGYIKDCIKLAWNVSQKATRDNLYVHGINPVVSFPGLGTVLYGDKTLQSKPSAFDRINVRRLFIILEKAIATYSKYILFEFNDAITRAQFVNAITPYLRDIQGRRGIYDFKVIADETVNTAEVIDSNSFVANIMIKPARSINTVTLNFVAVATGISFNEVV